MLMRLTPCDHRREKTNFFEICPVAAVKPANLGDMPLARHPDKSSLHDVMEQAGPGSARAANQLLADGLTPGSTRSGRMVEPDGIEPTTSCLQSTRSSN